MTKRLPRPLLLQVGGKTRNQLLRNFDIPRGREGLFFDRVITRSARDLVAEKGFTTAKKTKSIAAGFRNLGDLWSPGAKRMTWPEILGNALRAGVYPLPAEAIFPFARVLAAPLSQPGYLLLMDAIEGPPHPNQRDALRRGWVFWVRYSTQSGVVLDAQIEHLACEYDYTLVVGV